MATAVWTGTVSFGLVSIPVKLFTATTSHNISFNLLHRECKNRIQLQNYCPHCERVVERSELVKGYQYEKDQYVVIDDEDLAAAKPEASSNLDIQQFIEVKEVDPIFYERSYYLGPDKGSEKTFSLFTNAMRETGRAALGKLVMRSHEYMALIRPGMKGLIVHFMLYEDEIRQNEFTVDENANLRPKEVELAKQLIQNLTEPFEPEKYKDEYTGKVEEVIEAKMKGRKLTIVAPKARPKVVDLMEALQQSVQATKKGAAAKRPVARAGAEAKPARQRKAR
jgi:DNA end-binding protein Ku